MKAANGSTPIDASKLGEMGVATSADAIAGIFGTLIGGFCVDRVRRWHWVLCFYLIWQGLAFMSWTIVDNCKMATLSRLVTLSVSLTWKYHSCRPAAHRGLSALGVRLDAAFLLDSGGDDVGLGGEMRALDAAEQVSAATVCHHTVDA